MRKIFFLLLLPLLLLVSCSAQPRDTGNIGTPCRTVTYCSGICYIEDNTVYRTLASGDAEILYAEPEGILTGLAADGETVYFLCEKGDIYKNRAVIGKITADGSVFPDLTTPLCEAAGIAIQGEIGELHILQSKLFLSGNQIYGSAYLFDPKSGTAAVLPVMYPGMAYTEDTVYYTEGGYEIFSVSADTLSPEHYGTVFYDGALFSGYSKEPFYNGIGIEHMTADGDVLYIALAASDGYAVYRITADVPPVHLYTHPIRIRELVCYESRVYFSDGVSVYRLTEGTPEVLCAVSGEQPYDFVIHNSRLYPRMDDFSEFLDLTK